MVSSNPASASTVNDARITIQKNLCPGPETVANLAKDPAKLAIWKSQVLISSPSSTAYLGPYNTPAVVSSYGNIFPSRPQDQILATMNPLDAKFLNDIHSVFRISYPAKKDEYIRWYERVEPVKRELWKTLGISDVISLSVEPIKYNFGLLLAALFFWHPSTSTFHTRLGMIAPTLFDLAAITGLRPDGEIPDFSPPDAVKDADLIPEHVVKKLDKSCSDLVPHNMVITDFNGKTSKSPGCIALDLTVGSITRTTVFIVVPSEANYNLLLGREWIHGVGVIPSTLHQLMFMWDNLGRLEFVRGDEDYFKCEVNNADFEKNLSNIEPMNVLNKSEFYLKYPVQVQLSPTSLCLNRICDHDLASKILRDAGVDCKIFKWEYYTEEEQPPRTSYCQVIEYNAEGEVVGKERVEGPITFPPSRDQVYYPDIQPTGWED